MLVVILRFFLCSLLCTGRYFACFRALRRHLKHISNMLNSFVTRVMQPTNGTQHQTSLWVSRQRSPLDSRGMSYIYLMGKKTARKSGRSKLGEKNNALRLRFAICATNSLLLCVGKRDVNKMCKSRSRTSTFCWRPLRLWYPFLLVTSSSKTFSGLYFALLSRFLNFFFYKLKDLNYILFL